MKYNKTLKKWKGKLERFHKKAMLEFENRAFRNFDNDVFYLNIEHAIEKLQYSIELWLDSVDYEKENPSA